MEQEKKIAKIDEAISQVQAKLNDAHLCEGTADTITRISGYHRPVSCWNDGKKAEMTQRREYTIAA
jgi:anaerobic ribonucleoside-triphosphate reductase